MPSADRLRCDQVLEQLEAYDDRVGGEVADGALLTLDPAALEDHLARCPACARELALARRIRCELQRLPAHLPELPPATPPPRPASRAHRGRLLLAAAALAVLAAVSLGWWQLASPVRPTAAELAQAEREARYALALLEEMSRRSGEELRRDVLQRQVVEPTSRALADALAGGDQERP